MPWDESLLFPNSLNVDLFFWGGGERRGEDRHGKNHSNLHPMFLNGVICDSGFCGLISLTTKNSRSFDF